MPCNFSPTRLPRIGRRLHLVVLDGLLQDFIVLDFLSLLIVKTGTIYLIGFPCCYPVSLFYPKWSYVKMLSTHCLLPPEL